jgi:hypothetical protein
VTHWFDPKGFNAYGTAAATSRSEDRATGKVITTTVQGRRYSARKAGMNSVSQILVHHTGGDGNGAANVFETLHNQRKLSVHFVVDDDGRVWQFLDVVEAAWHGGALNGCSVGIECNLFPFVDDNPTYYSDERRARTGNLPHAIGEQTLQGQRRRVFMMPAAQVDALARLCAGIWAATALATVCKLQAPRFPRTSAGAIPTQVIASPEKHVGLIGHLHATAHKVDPAGLDLATFEGQVAAHFAALTP